MKYYFSDGTVITGATGTLSPNGRADISSTSIAAVRSKVSSNANFRTYSISVSGVGNSSTDGTTNAAPLAVLTRVDTTTGRAISTEPTQAGAPINLNDPIFGG